MLRFVCLLMVMTALAASDAPADPDRTVVQDLGDGRTRVWVPGHWGSTRSTATEVYEAWIPGHWVMDDRRPRPAVEPVRERVIERVVVQERRPAPCWPTVAPVVAVPGWCHRGWSSTVVVSAPLWSWHRHGCRW